MLRSPLFLMLALVACEGSKDTPSDSDTATDTADDTGADSADDTGTDTADDTGTDSADTSDAETDTDDTGADTDSDAAATPSARPASGRWLVRDFSWSSNTCNAPALLPGMTISDDGTDVAVHTESMRVYATVQVVIPEATLACTEGPSTWTCSGTYASAPTSLDATFSDAETGEGTITVSGVSCSSVGTLNLVHWDGPAHTCLTPPAIPTSSTTGRTAPVRVSPSQQQATPTVAMTNPDIADITVLDDQGTNAGTASPTGTGTFYWPQTAPPGEMFRSRVILGGNNAADHYNVSWAGIYEGTTFQYATPRLYRRDSLQQILVTGGHGPLDPGYGLLEVFTPGGDEMEVTVTGGTYETAFVLGNQGSHYAVEANPTRTSQGNLYFANLCPGNVTVSVTELTNNTPCVSTSSDATATSITVPIVADEVSQTRFFCPGL